MFSAQYHTSVYFEWIGWWLDCEDTN